MAAETTPTTVASETSAPAAAQAPVQTPVTPPALVQPAPAPAPAPLTVEDVRRTLSDGIRGARRTNSRSRSRGDGESESEGVAITRDAAVDTSAGKAHNTDTAPAPAASPAAAPDAPPASRAEAPAAQPQPQAQAQAAAPDAASETPPPAGETAPPAAPAPSTGETPATTTPPPSRARRGLPPEYDAPEWQQRFAADPQLRRTIARIEGDPQLSPSAKALALASQISKSDARLAELQRQREAERELMDNDPEGYVAHLKAQQARAEADRDLQLAVTQLLAEALDTDLDDQDFLMAGAREGEPREAGLERFKEYLLSKSPLVAAHVQAALGQQATAHQQQIEAVKAEYDAQIKALKKDYEARIEAALAEGRAEGRGTTVAPPRATTSMPAEAATPFVPSELAIRNLLRQGIHHAQERHADL